MFRQNIFGNHNNNSNYNNGSHNTGNYNNGSHAGSNTGDSASKHNSGAGKCNSYENSDVYKNMHPKKRQIIEELVKNTNGRKLKDCAPAIMMAVRRMNNDGLTFDRAESECMMNILTSNMSPEEKQQAEMFAKTFASMKKDNNQRLWIFCNLYIICIGQLLKYER